MRRSLLFLLLCAGCGGTLGGDDSTDASGDVADASSDVAISDGGWTACSSPSGQKVCDGPNACTHENCECPFVGDDSPTAVHVCIDSAGYEGSTDCPYVEDGLLCVAPEDALPTFYWGAEFDMGVLFANNGAADRVRYADYGAWTGDPLPTPANCPTLATAHICGANCGGCNGDFICHGRSPLHPYGVCLPNNINDTCNIAKNIHCTSLADKCFAYTVQPEDQDLANANSICLPSDMCDDLAANLPGGGVCQ